MKNKVLNAVRWMFALPPKVKKTQILKNYFYKVIRIRGELIEGYLTIDVGKFYLTGEQDKNFNFNCCIPIIDNTFRYLVDKWKYKKYSEEEYKVLLDYLMNSDPVKSLS